MVYSWLDLFPKRSQHFFLYTIHRRFGLTAIGYMLLFAGIIIDNSFGGYLNGEVSCNRGVTCEG